MPRSAIPSTLRTTSLKRFRPVFIWAIIGLTVSLALVVASPCIAGEGSTGVSECLRYARSRSWLRTEYGMMFEYAAGAPSPTVDAPVAVRQLYEAEYPLTGMPMITWVPGTQFVNFNQIETGFPLRSFSGWAVVDLNNGTLISTQGLLPVGNSRSDSIPFNPHWPALLFNAAAWGITLWATSLCPAALRRLIRRRRGLCLHCAYDLRATPPTTPCPECGHLHR